MSRSIAEFGRKLSGSEVALFYYAGHGIQIKSQNYLIPINAILESDASVPYQSINLNQILEEMEDGNSRINIVIIDACRNNPISGKFRSGQSRGLAAPNFNPKGTVIVYATDPGNVAADGTGRNGLFTSGLLKAFRGNDLSLDGVLTAASAEVERASGQTQTPYVNGPKTLQKNFHFKITVEPGPAEIERTFWTSIERSTDPADFDAYLRKYPNGNYAILANNAIKKLKGESQPLRASPVAGDNNGNLSAQKSSEASRKDLHYSAIRLGDRWKYAVTDKFKRTKIRDEVLQVEKIDADGIFYLNQNYRTDHSGVNVISSMDNTAYSPSSEFLRFPIEIGKQWAGEFTTRTGDNRIKKHKFRSTAIRSEKITVAAGAFDTFYIEQTSYFDGGTSASAESTGAWSTSSVPWLTTTQIWYSPRIKNIVKMESKTRNNVGKTVEWEQRELIEYELK